MIAARQGNDAGTHPARGPQGSGRRHPVSVVPLPPVVRTSGSRAGAFHAALVASEHASTAPSSLGGSQVGLQRDTKGHRRRTTTGFWPRSSRPWSRGPARVSVRRSWPASGVPTWWRGAPRSRPLVGRPGPTSRCSRRRWPKPGSIRGSDAVAPVRWTSPCARVHSEISRPSRPTLSVGSTVAFWKASLERLALPWFSPRSNLIPPGPAGPPPR